MIRLHEHPESGNSHKVRLLLSFLGLRYESVRVDLLTGEQLGEAFRSLNPRGEVPVLEDDGVVLRDSMAILVYLARRYDATQRWLPPDPAAEAAVMEWLAFAAGWIQYGVFSARAIVAFGIGGNGLPHETSVDPREGQLRGQRSLEILEAHLGSRDWLAAEHETVADVACFPYIALAPMGNVSLEPFAGVRRWIERFRGLSGFVDMPGLTDPGYRSS